MKWSYKDFWWRPKFTFSTFTRDPNLQTPHLHKTQIYTSPNLHRSDLHKTKFTQPNIDIPKFTRLKFTQKLNPNSHRPKFTQTQIYTHIFGHRLQDFKKPKFTRTACPRMRATLVRIVLFSCHIQWCDIIPPWLGPNIRTVCDIRATHRPEGPQGAGGHTRTACPRVRATHV